MLPIEGCTKALTELASEFRIVVATSRRPTTDNWTKEWLDANRIKYHHFVNTWVAGKSLPEVQILVDDYDKNIKEFIESGDNSRKAILFTQPWNKDHQSLNNLILTKKVCIATSWSSVIHYIRYHCYN